LPLFIFLLFIFIFFHVGLKALRAFILPPFLIDIIKAPIAFCTVMNVYSKDNTETVLLHFVEK